MVEYLVAQVAAGWLGRDHVVFLSGAAGLVVSAGVDGGRLQREFEDLTAGIGARFGRVETCRTVVKMLAGMVPELPSKNCWTLAEKAGDIGLGRMQHLLSRALVDEGGLGDDLRDSLADRKTASKSELWLVVACDEGWVMCGTDSLPVLVMTAAIGHDRRVGLPCARCLGICDR